MRSNPFPFLKALVWSVVLLLTPCQGGESVEDAARPNILFCIADDWGWPHASAYGDPVVRTPAFDRVAREGVLFRHAYISSPSCTPSRNAILTGQYHWRLGPGANLWSTLDTSVKTFPNLLSDAGYHCGHRRKSWGPGRLDNWKKVGKHPAGPKIGGGLPRFLEMREENNPFCFWLGASDPHRGYKKGSGAASGIDPAAIELFPHFPDSPEVRGDVADYYFEVQRFDGDVMKALEQLEDGGDLANTLVIITGDHGMPFPRCKSNLYDSGARVPLAMMWQGKIKPGRMIEDFVSTTDLAPTFLELAGLPIPEEMSGESLAPILLGDQTGRVDGDRDHVIFGKERHVPGQEAPDMGGYPSRAIRTHEWLYIRNYRPDRWPSGTPHHEKATMENAWLADTDNGPTKSYIVANKLKDEVHRRAYELSFGKRPAEELYNCVEDPGQLDNLADDPRFADVKSRLASLLQAELRESGDPRETDAEVTFDSHPYLGGVPKHPDHR